MLLEYSLPVDECLVGWIQAPKYLVYVKAILYSFSPWLTMIWLILHVRTTIQQFKFNICNHTLYNGGQVGIKIYYTKMQLTIFNHSYM